MMITDKNGIERFSVSQKLYDYLMDIKNKVTTTDSEYWIILYGKTGCGKSVKAQHMGFVIDPTLEGDSSRVCLKKDEFIQACIKSKKQVVIGDESMDLFFNRRVMTKEQTALSLFAEQIRQNNLVILLCVPNALTLDQNILEKANCIINVWEDKKNNTTIKGNCAFFPNSSNEDNVKHKFKERLLLYLRHQKKGYLHKTKFPKPYFREKGTSISNKVWYPVGEEVYKKKKAEILDKFAKGEETTKSAFIIAREKKWFWQRNEAIVSLRKKGATYDEISKLLKIDRKEVREIVKKESNSTGNEGLAGTCV